MRLGAKLVTRPEKSRVSTYRKGAWQEAAISVLAVNS